MSELRNTYKKISHVILCNAILVLNFFLYQPPKILGIILFGTIVCLCFVVLKLTFKIISIIPGNIPFKYFFLGAFVVLGGTCFDVAMTITFTPDLMREANPFIRFFIEIGLPLKQIYLLGLFGQILYATLMLTLWASFLKAYPILINSIPFCGVMNTIVKICGGVNATKIDLFLNRVDYFYSINSIIPVLVTSSFYRWYLALEWLEWAPISRIYAPALICLLGFIAYIGFSYRLIERNWIKA